MTKPTTLLALALLALSALSSLAHAETTRDAPARKTMLMHYMPWYESPDVRGVWGGHWTGWGRHNPEAIGEDGLPDIYSHFHPLIGLYDSADPHVVECQLLQMKIAGVDGVIADWYGIANAADYPPIHEATKVLFDKAGEFDMSFAVCFEDRTVEVQVKQNKLAEDRIPDHLAETLGWLESNWFSQEHYFRIDGRPLFMLFGPIYVHEPKPWDIALSSIDTRPMFFPLHHLWQKAGGDGGFTWVHQQAWEGEPTRDQILSTLDGIFRHPARDPALVAEQVIASVVPGFIDIYDQSYLTLDHREGKTLDEHLEVVMNGPWPVVQLVTWNDYGEGTMFEPTHEFGYRFLEQLQDVRRAEGGITGTHQDLRLPARLLEIRRSEYTDTAHLDQISAALSDGRYDAARRMLASLERRR